MTESDTAYRARMERLLSAKDASPSQEVLTLDLTQIRTDGGTQPRAGLDEEMVAAYAGDMLRGDPFPPVDVMFDGEAYWLYDGFHRVAARRRVGAAVISAHIHQGNQADAQWASYRANRDHGLRRSHADVERAVKAALRHPKAEGMSASLLAKHIGVSDKTVTRYREILELTSEFPKSLIRTGADGRRINTANIGKKAEPPATEPAPEPSPAPKPPAEMSTPSSAAIKLRYDRLTEAGYAFSHTPPKPAGDGKIYVALPAMGAGAENRLGPFDDQWVALRAAEAHAAQARTEREVAATPVVEAQPAAAAPVETRASLDDLHRAGIGIGVKPGEGWFWSVRTPKGAYLTACGFLSVGAAAAEVRRLLIPPTEHPQAEIRDMVRDLELMQARTNRIKEIIGVTQPVSKLRDGMAECIELLERKL